ncbi:hypothetical protein LINGRAHAP2_LOCUS11728, partial [Linum grandiflorum]
GYQTVNEPNPNRLIIHPRLFIHYCAACTFLFFFFIFRSAIAAFNRPDNLHSLPSLLQSNPDRKQNIRKRHENPDRKHIKNPIQIESRRKRLRRYLVVVVVVQMASMTFTKEPDMDDEEEGKCRRVCHCRAVEGNVAEKKGRYLPSFYDGC